MEKNEYKNIFELEENHWWYKGMRKISLSLIKRITKSKDIRILDAGCGTGINLTILNQFGTVYGTDISKEAIKFCKRRNIRNVFISSVEKLPIKNNCLELITSFEVIYHKNVENDIKALKEFNRILKENGYLLIRLPAFKFLYSYHDKIVHTARRYTITK